MEVGACVSGDDAGGPNDTTPPTRSPTTHDEVRGRPVERGQKLHAELTTAFVMTEASWARAVAESGSLGLVQGVRFH